MPNQAPTVLVVDDDELMREFVVAAVNRIGFVAVGRPDPGSAMETVKTMPSLKILISDVCLESGTGPDLVRQALRSRPELKVVFMTGGFDDVSFRQTDPVLYKPFDLQRLRGALESVLNQSHPPFQQREMVGERRRIVTCD